MACAAVQSKKDIVELERDNVEIGNEDLTMSSKGSCSDDCVEDQELENGEEEDTVVDDFHPLANKWALWFFKNERGKSWTENQKQVAVFGSVEEFWGLVNHVRPLSEIPIGCDYSLFKEGIMPMWEDKNNVEGGRWLIMVDKAQRQTLLDDYWMEIMMLLIGETMGDDDDLVCGAVANIRAKGDRLSVWTRNCVPEGAVVRIGRKLKEVLHAKCTISYQQHSDQQNKTGSLAKSIYNV